MKISREELKANVLAEIRKEAATQQAKEQADKEEEERKQTEVFLRAFFEFNGYMSLTR